MIKKIKDIEINENNKQNIVAGDKYIPDDEKIPLKDKDPEDLPEDDPFENPKEEPPQEGEGP